MTEKSLSVTASMETRPAALFVQCASRFASTIKVRIGHRTVNAKSIMGIISLGILDGQTVTLIAEGDDEAEAVNALASHLENM